MFVIDDRQPKFLNKLTSALSCRGVDCASLNNFTSCQNTVGDAYYIGQVKSDFDCSSDKSFVSFLKTNKFKKAFLIMSSSDEFEVSRYFNSAVTVLKTPVSIIEENLVSKYYLNVFMEVILNTLK